MNPGASRRRVPSVVPRAPRLGKLKKSHSHMMPQDPIASGEAAPTLLGSNRPETAGSTGFQGATAEVHGLERTPVILVTGFLGAGKTTLIRRWLSESPMTGRKLGVVMNDFGTVNVDALLVQKPDLPVTEVQGGCLCCAPDQDLSRAVSQLVRDQGCGLVVIEPSGLADPVATLDALTDPDELKRFELRAVVAVVDALAYSETAGDEGTWQMLKAQVRYADWVLVSKCDTAPAPAVERLLETCRSLNATAQIRRMPRVVPMLPDLLAGPPTVQALALEKEPPANPPMASPHMHARYRSVTFRFPLAIQRSAFEEFLRQLDRTDVVRAKGFVRFSGRSDEMYVFQSVYGHFVIDEYPARPHPEAVAVLIGPSLDPAKHTARLQRLVWGRRL